MEVERKSDGTFAPGHKRLPGSGRARNVPNAWKKEIYDDLMARLAAQDFDIVSEFLRVYRSKKSNNETKSRLLLGLAQFIWPKRMAVAVTKRTETKVSLVELMKNPAVAKAMETLSFAVESEKHNAKLLPAPIDAEFCDPEPGDARRA